MEFSKILVAIDFSPDSNRAIDAALELVRSDGGKVTLLHVCELPAYSTPEYSMYVPSPELTEEMCQQAKETLEDYRLRCASAGVTVDVACLLGTSVAAEIVDYAAGGKFDLIVVGTHGRRGLRRLVLGSVAEKVVRTADRPVLTVHAHEAAVEHEAT
jgi:nucleotide-binding universal stress UspA family protein